MGSGSRPYDVFVPYDVLVRGGVSRDLRSGACIEYCFDAFSGIQKLSVRFFPRTAARVRVYLVVSHGEIQIDRTLRHGLRTVAQKIQISR